MGRFGRWLVPMFYGRLAWAYDAAVWLIGSGLWYRWGFTAERYLAGEPVLEVGCGTGHLLERLASRGVEVTGLDRSRQMVKAARRRLIKAGLAANVIHGKAQSLPFPAASVGTIVTVFPSGYARDERTWREFARVLRPGGRWILTTGLSSRRPLVRLLGLYVLRLIEHGWRRRRSPGRGVTIPGELFAHQREEAVPVGPTTVNVAILEKD